MTERSTLPGRILLVEDDRDQADLLQLVFQRIAPELEIIHVDDGAEAIDYLFREGAYREAPRPNIVLLDLNLPKRTGHEVLERVKADPALCQIPILILSNSDAEQDRTLAYQLHANAFLSKSGDFDCLREMMDAVQRFWMEWNAPAGDAIVGSAHAA